MERLIRIGNEPIAMTRNATLFYIHADHLGRPESVTNATKTVVWRARNFAFERTIATDNFGGLNLGFPGQYYDQETGSSYNVNRDYDGITGRYGQVDPIGVQLSADPYLYVGGNPVSEIDPYGLATFQIGLTLNFQISPINVNGTYGIVADSSLNVGTYGIVGAGAGAGANAFGGLNIAVSDGDCINDISDFFGNESASLGSGAAGGVDVFGGQGSHGQPIAGVGFSMGIGVGGQYSVGGSYTWVTPLWPR